MFVEALWSVRIGTPEGSPLLRIGELSRRPTLENLTLWQRVHEHLRQEILDNRLPPGSELNEDATQSTINSPESAVEYHGVVQPMKSR